MKHEELYIPPCCIDKLLPHVISSGGSCSIFYSQGDWGLPKLLHAVTCMVKGNALTILVVRDLNVFMLRRLSTELAREWSGGLAIVTQTEVTDMIKSELQEHLSRVWYAGGIDEAAQSNMWIRSTDLLNLVVSGPLATTEEELPHRLCTYTASLQRNPNVAKMAFKPWRSILRLHATIQGDNDIFKDWLT